MPQGYKDPGTLVAEIKMTRTLHDGAFLVVEGADDVRFWRTRRHEECELIDGEGKPNVVGGLQRLDAEGHDGVLGVVDDDYDSLMGVSYGSRNLVATDAHDLECLLCRSSALDKVLAEFGSSSKISQFERDTGVDARTGLLERALVFGRLRWAAVYFQLKVNPKAIRISRFVDIDTWTVDSEELARAVVPQGSSDVLTRSIAQLPLADPWYVARGHDMMELLRIGLMRVLGDIGASTGTKQISQVLRAAISPGELRKTTLWMDIRAWEIENQSYPVLTEED